MKVLVNVLISILNTNLVVFGFTLSLLDIVLFLAFGSLAAFFIGGIFR